MVIRNIKSGWYIEGLYLSTQVIKNYPSDLPPDARNLVLEPLLRVVAGQQKPLLDLIAVLKSIPQDEVVESMEVEMGVLRFYFDEIGDIESKISTDPVHVVLDQGLLKDITNEIARIRKTIVETT